MATIDAALNGTRGIGSRLKSASGAFFTVAGTGTLKAQIVVPAGSWFRSVGIETPVAISGTPTTCNVSVGLTDGGAEVVAAVDAKGQGHIAATIVTALDKIGAFAAADTTLYVTLVTTGGAAPAGAITAIADFDAPVR